MELIWPASAVAIPPLAMTPALQQHLQTWLQEDLGRGDLSAAALQGCCGQAHWISKADGVFCGGQLAAAVFGLMDSGVTTQVLVNDGEAISAGTRLLELGGPAAALVGAERTALNLAMRLSGIATATAALASQLQGSGVQLVDTRKTTPACGCSRNTRCVVVAAATTAWASTMPRCSRKTTWPGPAGLLPPLRPCAQQPLGPAK